MSATRVLADGRGSGGERAVILPDVAAIPWRKSPQHDRDKAVIFLRRRPAETRRTFEGGADSARRGKPDAEKRPFGGGCGHSPSGYLPSNRQAAATKGEARRGEAPVRKWERAPPAGYSPSNRQAAATKGKAQRGEAPVRKWKRAQPAGSGSGHRPPGIHHLTDRPRPRRGKPDAEKRPFGDGSGHSPPEVGAGTARRRRSHQTFI